MESYRSTILGYTPLLAGLALTIIGAVKGDNMLLVTGLGLLGSGGVGLVARDQKAHDLSQPPKP